MPKVQTPAPAKTDKPAEAVSAGKTATTKKPEPPAIEYVTSTQLAATIGIKSTILRRWLRTLPQYSDGGYTRYKWEPTDPFLKEAKERYEKFAASETEKQAKRLEDVREKAAKKEAGPTEKAEKKAKAKKDPKPEAQVEEEVFDEEGEEAEEELE